MSAHRRSKNAGSPLLPPVMSVLKMKSRSDTRRIRLSAISARRDGVAVQSTHFTPRARRRFRYAPAPGLSGTPAVYAGSIRRVERSRSVSNFASMPNFSRT